jgi:hypothetical protein
MTDKPQQGTPAPSRKGKGRALKILLALAGMALVLEFGVTGFIIGLYERVSPSFFGAHIRPVAVFFSPAIRVARASPTVMRFYVWQFRAAADNTYIIGPDMSVALPRSNERGTE